MSRTITPGQYAEPILSTGDPAAKAGGRGIYTLAVGTYYVDLGGQTSPYHSTHMQWSAALAATITFWTSDFAPSEAALISTTAGDWVQQDPSTAYVPTGTGYTPTNLTIVVAGTNAGGTQINLAGFAASRLRARVVVTTGGTLRTARAGKA